MSELLGGEFARYSVAAHLAGPGHPAMMAKSANAPTRLSSIPGTEDYDPYWSERVAEVRIDGRIIWQPVRFDIREGWVDCYEHDMAKGVIASDEIHRVRGKVTVGYALDEGEAR